MPAKPMNREDGELLATGEMRVAKMDGVVPMEIRRHPGAGKVTWIQIDGTWRIMKAEGP